MTLRLSIRPLNAEDVAGCERILRGLPEWFGFEEAVARYVRDLTSLPGLVAVSDWKVLGFIVLRRHTPQAGEVHVMAVHGDHRRQGIGRALVEALENGLPPEVRLLEVKTLGPSHPDEGYRQTRAFYAAMGFVPLEETTAFWGEKQPCLIMVKPLQE
jgi:GNAT superfamily N-acetyltransferase